VGVPAGEGVESPILRNRAVGREYVQMRVPLKDIATRGHGYDDPRPCVFAELLPQVLGDRLGCRLGQVAQQVAPPPEEGTQEARDRHDDMTVCHRCEDFLAQPFGPQDRALLLT
jgi:hypothetical protein